MDFRDPNTVGTFVYHCHLLEHEDKGMMGSIRVDPRRSLRAKCGADVSNVMIPNAGDAHPRAKQVINFVKRLLNYDDV